MTDKSDGKKLTPFSAEELGRFYFSMRGIANVPEAWLVRLELTIAALQAERDAARAHGYDEERERDKWQARAETAEAENAELKASVAVLVEGIKTIAEQYVPSTAGVPAERLDEALAIQGTKQDFVAFAQKILDNLPAAARAHIAEVEAVKANARTPGTLEVCETCNMTIRNYDDCAMFPATNPCPILAALFPQPQGEDMSAEQFKPEGKM